MPGELEGLQNVNREFVRSQRLFSGRLLLRRKVQ